MTAEVAPQTLHLKHFKHAQFEVDAVLFDMDGTLVDSISAVEATWGSVAKELGKDPQEVIDATHGRRAIDNLKDLKPELRRLSEADMDPHVKEFETKILENADTFNKEVRSRRESVASSRSASRRASRSASGAVSPFINSNGQSGSNSPKQSSSRSGSMSANGKPPRKGSFAQELSKRMAAMSMSKPPTPAALDSGIVASPSGVESPRELNDDVFEDDDDEEIDIDSIQVDTSDLTDNSVVILPGVRRMIDSIPHGKWCVATSGATTYCHGALKRVGIELPPVVVTADHKELKRGKPFPDPFILAAEKMGYDPKRCLVVEDSPSGLKAGIASGAKVLAVCTSHELSKICDLVTDHYIVPTLDKVTVIPQPSGRLLIKIDV